MADEQTITYASLPPLDLSWDGDLDSLPPFDDGVTKHMGPGNHPNGTPQAVHGRGGTLGYLASETSSPDGGFTYSQRFGMPTGGKALSIYPDREREIPPGTDPDTKVSILTDFIEANADLLASPNHYVGGWNDPATGITHLDVSVNVPDADTAVTLGQATEQIAYFDLDTFRSVTLGIRHPDGRYEPLPLDAIEKGAALHVQPGGQDPGGEGADPGRLPAGGEPEPWQGWGDDLVPLFKHLGPGNHPSGSPQTAHAGSRALTSPEVDPTQVPEKFRDAMNARAAKLGITPELLDATLQAALDRGDLAHAEWYEAIHERANELADQYSTDTTTTAGVIAAISPAREFGKNMRDAEQILRTIDEDLPFTPTPEDIVTYNAKRDPKRPILAPGTYRPSELDAAVLTGVHPDLNSLGNRTGLTHVARAVAIAKGADVNQVLSGPKVRSFYTNIADPSAPAVTIDTWMYRAMVPADHVYPDTAGVIAGVRADEVEVGNRKIQNVYQGSPGALKGTGMPSNVGLYPMFAESVQRVAATNDLAPHAVQAIVWEVARVDAGYTATNLGDYIS